MKYFSIILIFIVGIISCRKNNFSSRTKNVESKLNAIYSDSAGAWKFGYTNELITSLSPDTEIAQYGNTANIQYVQADPIQYVKLNFTADPTSFFLRFLLTPSKLPLQIDQGYFAGGTEHSAEFAKFIYVKNTNLLDSVIVKVYSGLSIIFKIIYTNQNIINITETSIYDGQRLATGTFNFSYIGVPNIFRHTDSLLYIYSYPQTVFYAQPMVIPAFFAETFSVSTFNSISISSIPGNLWGQDPVISKMTYVLNEDEKITEENFSNEIFEDLAGKKYYYH